MTQRHEVQRALEPPWPALSDLLTCLECVASRLLFCRRVVGAVPWGSLTQVFRWVRVVVLCRCELRVVCRVGGALPLGSLTQVSRCVRVTSRHVMSCFVPSCHFVSCPLIDKGH